MEPYEIHVQNSRYSCRSRLKKSNEMQLYADIYLLLNYFTCFGHPSRPSSGVHKTVVEASGTDHTIWGACFLKRDQIMTGVEPTVPHQSRLQLQFYVLLMMGAMDARNIHSNLSVNKYLLTVASLWISST